MFIENTSIKAKGEYVLINSFRPIAAVNNHHRRIMTLQQHAP